MIAVIMQSAVALIAVRCVHLKAIRDRRSPTGHQLGALNAVFIGGLLILALALVGDAIDGARHALVWRRIELAGLVLLNGGVGLSLLVLVGKPRTNYHATETSQHV